MADACACLGALMVLALAAFGCVVVRAVIFPAPWVNDYDYDRMRSRGEISGGDKQGWWVLWWPGGRKECEGHDRDGDRVGIWTYWDEHGVERVVDEGGM